MSNPFSNVVAPIFPKGRVEVNSSVDRLEIRRRRKRSATRTALYPAHGDDANIFSILNREPLLMRKRTKRDVNHVATNSDVYVLSSVNGAGYEGQNPRELMKEFHFAGFSDSNVIVEKSNHDLEMVAAHVGGLKTTLNTGDKRIRTGDVLQIAMPDPSKPVPWKEATGYDGTKILPAIVPYDPTEREPSAENLYMSLTGKHMASSQGRYKSSLDETAEMFKEMISGVGAIAVYAAIRMGLVEPVVPANAAGVGTTAAQLRQAQAIARQRFEGNFIGNGIEPAKERSRQELLRQIYAAFGATEDPEYAALEAPPLAGVAQSDPRVRATSQLSLQQHLVEFVFARTYGYDLVDTGSNRQDFPDGIVGDIVQKQRRLVTRSMGAYESARLEEMSNVIGRAVQDAPIGKPLTMIVNHAAVW